MKKMKAQQLGEILEVAVAKCGGRLQLERANEEGWVIKKRQGNRYFFIFKEQQHEQH